MPLKASIHKLKKVLDIDEFVLYIVVDTETKGFKMKAEARVIETTFKGKAVKVTYYDVCDLLEESMGEKFYMESWDAQTVETKKWAKKLNAAYYASERHSFSLADAADKALKAGKSVVIVEDLS